MTTVAPDEAGKDRRDDAALASLAALARIWDETNPAEAFPAARIGKLHDVGILSAFVQLPDRAAVIRLDRALRLIGGADLSLGRIAEGHLNAAQLVHAYGTEAQRAGLARDLAVGRTLGVWNTEPAPGMAATPVAQGWRLDGAKSFATGAGHIGGALITARQPDGGKRMVLVDLGGQAARVDNRRWRVRGMRGTMSGTFDFTGMVVPAEAMIGAPNDYEREPRFSAGAWRFAAVQQGASEAVMRHWRDHLVATGKGADAIQRARFARALTMVRSAGLWVRQAALLAEAATGDAGGADAIAHVLMTRGVVEDAALAAMEGAARAVGTAAFFEDSRIDRITRDLGLYLRQPVPDQARDRAAAAWLAAERWGGDDAPWW